MSSPKNLKELLIHMLKDIYYAEKQLTKALPKLEEKATNALLKKGFSDHLAETKQHVERLEEVFKLLGEKARGEKCEAIEGIIKEGDEAMKIKDPETRDAAVIAAAQAAEHYEIARYGTLISWAGRLNLKEAQNLLRDTIAEEKDADSKLTRLAEDKLNQKAAA